MKKQLCILGVLTLASSVFSQGTVAFNNNSSGLIMAEYESDAAPTPVLQYGGFVQLLWNPSTTATLAPWDLWGGQTFASFMVANPGWSLVPNSIRAINGPGHGRVTGGTVTIPTPTPGAAIKVAVLGWTGNFISAEAAYSGRSLAGVSAPFIVDTADPTSDPPEVPTSMAGLFPTFTLIPTFVPEPSSFTLAALGVTALLAFHRRK